MNFIIIIAIIVCMAVALLAVVIVLLYKYRKHKQEKEMKEKLYSNIYVKLFSQEDSKHPTKESERSAGQTTSTSPKLCRGLVSTYDTREQVSVSETELSDLDTGKARRKLAITKSSSLVRTNSCPDADDPLTPSMSDDNRTVDDSLSTISRLSKSSWRSLSSISSSKTRVAKIQKSAHTISLPKIYSSREEIKNSTSFLARNPRTGSKTEEEELDESSLTSEILLSILYSASVSSLTITILSIVDLPAKMELRSTYVRGVVRPKHSDFQLTKSSAGSNPQFNESFHFNNLRIEDMACNHLTLTVHKASSHKLIKELFIPLGNLKIENSITSHLKFPLTSGNRSRRKSTSERLLFHDLGQLMLLIDHQPVSHRLKVVINKAVQLPKSEISPFKPEYQVQTSLYDSVFDRKIETKQTALQPTQNPVWNDAFHFDLDSDSLNDYYLELTVVEKSRYRPHDAVIGHIILGSDRTNSDAVEQWTNCSSKTRLILPKWHSILPAIIYNTL